MKVLVTGATGLLGGHIVRELLQRAYQVRIFIRENSKLIGLEGLDVEMYQGELLEKEDIMKAANGCDVIIHAAANTSQWPTGFKHYESMNVDVTINILHVSRQLGLQKLVYVSTANVFGFGSKNKPGTELSEFRSFKFNSGYINSKYIAQQKVLSEVEKHHVPVVIVNPTFMIGAFDVKPSSGQIIQMGLGKKIQLCAMGGKNFIHVKDAAIAIVNALEKGRPGESYLLANENLTYKEFFRKLNAVTGESARQLIIPSFLIKLIGIFGSIYEKLVGKASMLNLVNARLLCLDNYYTGAKAVRELDMPQTSVDVAIKEAYEWFSSHGYLNGKLKK